MKSSMCNQGKCFKENANDRRFLFLFSKLHMQLKISVQQLSLLAILKNDTFRKYKLTDFYIFQIVSWMQFQPLDD